MKSIVIIGALTAALSPALAQVSPLSSDVNAKTAAAEEAAMRSLPNGETLRSDDVARLQQLDLGLLPILLGVLAKSTPEEREVLVGALSGQAMPPQDAMSIAPGDWKCRNVKMMDGDLPIIVYDNFACRIDADGRFEKLSGSQRTKGRIYPENGSLIYVGTGFIAGDTPPDYAELPENVNTASAPQRVPQVGRVEMTSPNAGRILFPRPYLDSDLDLLVLTR